MSSILALITQARTLPIGSAFTVAYLIQGEEDCSEAEQAMQSNRSDVFVLTYRTMRPDAIFFPGSTMAEGRNVLLAAAAAAELQRGFRYTYFTYLDADTTTSPPWHISLRYFESFLQFWQPAVGLPANSLRGFDDLSSSRKARQQGPGPVSNDVYVFDNIFVAFHAEATPALLPYNTSLDGTCWWISRWVLQQMALVLFRSHVLLLPSMRVGNSAHNPYPKDHCLDKMTETSLRLREAAPRHLRSCFPTPQVGFKRAFFAGAVWGSWYLPWGTPLRKGAVDYGEISLEKAASCDDEFAVRVIRQLQEPSAAQWCRDCTVDEAFYLLQIIAATDPFRAPSWNELGAWLARVGHYGKAAASFAISRKLLQKQSQPQSPQLEDNYVKVLEAAKAVGMPWFEESLLWEDAGMHLQLAVQAIMHVAHLPGQNLLDEDKQHRLIHFLLGGTDPDPSLELVLDVKHEGTKEPAHPGSSSLQPEILQIL